MFSAFTINWPNALARRRELRITKRAVDALTVSAKDTVFRDRDLAGFGGRVQPTGRKTYVVQSRGPSGPKRVTLGLHGDLSADEAHKQAAVVIDRIKRGEDPVPVVPETELTVAALAERVVPTTRTALAPFSSPATVKSDSKISSEETGPFRAWWSGSPVEEAARSPVVGERAAG